MKKFKWCESSSVAVNARTVLPEFFSAFYERAEPVLKSGDPKALHDFRLAAKKFRYSLEMFRGIHGSNMVQLLALMKDLQDRLGAISDCSTTRAMLAESDSPEFAAWLEARSARRIVELRRFWQERFDKASAQKWRNYLAAYPRDASTRENARGRKRPASRGSRRSSREVRPPG